MCFWGYAVLHVMSVLIQLKETTQENKKVFVKQEEQYSNSKVGFVSFHVVFVCIWLSCVMMD